MKIIKDESFFKTDTITLAKNLIGKWIITNTNGQEVTAQITETEAYLGINDSACHTYKNKRTKRTESMYKEGGTIYIYLCYGLHYLFNIVSKNENEPEAVLIRAVNTANGPAKLTKLLNINASLNGESIINNAKICIMDDEKIYSYTSDKRVGIDFANEKDKNAKLRFILKNA
ncbi:MAG: DNA-3-methyladenine glycosylase [Clostridiales bacterium]|nr:DNA-3-methyladenine glycosylase [Clostridiales bacterium]